MKFVWAKVMWVMVVCGYCVGESHVSEGCVGEGHVDECHVGEGHVDEDRVHLLWNCRHVKPKLCEFFSCAILEQFILKT